MFRRNSLYSLQGMITITLYAMKTVKVGLLMSRYFAVKLQKKIGDTN